MAHCWVLRQQDHGITAVGSLTGVPGAGGGVGLVFLVSWLHRAHMVALSLERVVCGVCGTGLLFENYIVDASIFYKKQFPRYMNLDLLSHPFGVG